MSRIDNKKIPLKALNTRSQRHTAALLLCTPLVAVSLNVNAQEESDKEVYRFAPIIVNTQAMADDDANSIVAQEISVGGKVATSILDTPASVSVITEKEIEQRHAALQKKCCNTRLALSRIITVRMIVMIISRSAAFRRQHIAMV